MACQHARARDDMVGHTSDTAGGRPRHNALCTMTRRPTRGVHAAWARCARSVDTARVPWVCALCTQPSFDSVHCSESLFGSLFMNTVHKVFKNKIK